MNTIRIRVVAAVIAAIGLWTVSSAQNQNCLILDVGCNPTSCDDYYYGTTGSAQAHIWGTASVGGQSIGANAQVYASCYSPVFLEAHGYRGTDSYGSYCVDWLLATASATDSFGNQYWDMFDLVDCFGARTGYISPAAPC